MTEASAASAIRPLAARLAHRIDAVPLDEAAQRRFFDEILVLTERAEAAAGRRQHWLDIAGVVIRVVFAGPALDDILMPALAHLEVPETAEAVTFRVWDSASTGVAMVQPPVAPGNFTERGDIWGMDSRQVLSAWHFSDYSLALGAVADRSCISWVAEPGSIPYWGRASPLRTLFHWAMRWHGRHLLHAAAVGTENGAVLITGRGGVGKSSTALSCLADGMSYIGDDYLVVALEPTPMVISLYGTAKVNADQWRRFPLFQDRIVNEAALAAEKAVFQLFPHHAGSLVRALPLRAVVAPEFANQPETSFAAIDPARLHNAAAITTISQLPQAGRDTEAFVEKMLTAVPGMTLRLGFDREAIPAAIRGWLSKPQPHPPPTPLRPRRPSLSVVISVHDEARLLGASVESVLAQGWDAVEIILVDDGSTDDVAGTAAALPVELRIFRQDHQGSAAAHHRGIREAHSDLIVFMEAGDLWPAGRLDALHAALERDPNLHGALGQVRHFQDLADSSRDYLDGPTGVRHHAMIAGMFRRNLFKQADLLDLGQEFSDGEDWAERVQQMGLRLARSPEVSLLVRRNLAGIRQMRPGVTLKELRIFKRLLDLRRASGSGGKGCGG